MKSFVIDLDGPVYGVDHGGRGRPIVLVHGLGGSHHNWAGVAPRLRHRGRVFALDLRGFGRTPLAGGSSIEANQMLVDGFIRHLADGPAVVVGNSMGGLVALAQAARHPDTVERLVLISPAAPVWEPAQVNPRWAAMNLLYLVPGIGRVAVSAYERSRSPAQRVRESFSLVAANPDRLEPLFADHVALAAERRRMPWAIPAFLEAYRSIVGQLPPPRYDRMVRSVSAPTLLLHGRADRIVPIGAAERLSRIRPDWTYVPLDDVGHAAQMEAPDRVAELIDRFYPTDQALTA